MKNKLVETVKFCFTADLIARLGTLADETEAGVEKALGKYVPLVFSRLSGRVGRGLSPEELFVLAHDADEAAVLKQLPALPTTAWQTRNATLVHDLLGESYSHTVGQVAIEAGIRPKASSTLLQVASTAVLGVLGRLITDNKLSVSDFVYWLHTQKEAIGTAMLRPETETSLLATALLPTNAATPLGAKGALGTVALERRWQWVGLVATAISLGYFFGHSSLVKSTAVEPPAAITAATPPPATKPILRTETLATTPQRAEPTPVASTVIGPATPIVSDEPSTITNPAPAAPAPVPTAPVSATPAPAPPVARPETSGRYDQDRDTYIYDTGRPIALTLADGTTQKVGANSTENRLFTFLASPAFQVDSVNRTKGWINFDRINFEAGKALLTPESALQLGNVASILNTFPNSIVKIGGYTDSTGDALSNFQLSEDRARAAMLTLTSMGVSADRLQSKGYGPKYFVRPNNTPAGRALNRRVSIRVLRK